MTFLSTSSIAPFDNRFHNIYQLNNPEMTKKDWAVHFTFVISTALSFIGATFMAYRIKQQGLSSFKAVLFVGSLATGSYLLKESLYQLRMLRAFQALKKVELDNPFWNWGLKRAFQQAFAKKDVVYGTGKISTNCEEIWKQVLLETAYTYGRHYELKYKYAHFTSYSYGDNFTPDIFGMDSGMIHSQEDWDRETAHKAPILFFVVGGSKYPDQLMRDQESLKKATIRPIYIGRDMGKQIINYLLEPSNNQ